MNDFVVNNKQREIKHKSLKDINKLINSKKKEFDKYGASVISKQDFLFSNEDWDTIYGIVEDKDLPLEFVDIGDVGEPNQLAVARFMTDIQKPEMVNREYSEVLLNVLYSDRIKVFFNKFFEGKNLYLRRCQLNIISQGGFIGQHLDCDSNPDYLTAIIIHLDNDFTGGDFYYYPNDKPKKIECLKNCVIVSSCLIEHEVLKVTSGQRRTIVYFLSEKNGLNKSTKLVIN